MVSEDFFYHSTLASPGGHGTPPREVPAGVLAEAGCHPKEAGGVAPQQALLGGLGKYLSISDDDDGSSRISRRSSLRRKISTHR